jgi:hypothetical protein
MPGQSKVQPVPALPAYSKPARLAAAAIAVVAWYALLLQLFVSVTKARTTSMPLGAAIINYFSFFTVLTNLLVALVLTFSLRTKPSRLSDFAKRPAVQAATAVYIGVVGLVYSLVLRNLWNPEGLHKIADVLLHDAIPVSYLGWWLLFARKDSLRFTTVPGWLAYPALYFVYCLIYARITGVYLYPFVNVSTLGYAGITLNAVMLLLGFLGLGLLLVAIGRWMPTNASE